ncbi:oligosaccharide flippase family protein [Telmatospirillum sp. J64-1]|uniref:oligosaccharide flippase family protein n=1 Tax=Telmatospirillum sp. J64-1 TaxID=2502183 RepID=UPI00115D3AB7|nr:oligosaccharide flippase family protein [Telmatospirillum sp. J64-1]
MIAAAFWALTRIAGQKLVAAAVFVVMARLLDPAELGLAVIAQAIVLLAVSALRAVTDAVIQAEDATEEFLSSLFWAALGGGLGLALTFLLAAPLLAAIFGQPDLAPLIQGLTPLCLLIALSVVPEGLLRRHLRFRSLALCEGASFLAGGVLAVLLALHGWGVWSLIVYVLTAQALFTAALWPVWRPSLRFSSTALRRALPLAASIGGMNLLNHANARIMDVALGLFFGPVLAAQYRVAHQLLDLVTHVTLMPLQSLALPVLSRLQHDPRHLAETFLALIRKAALLVFPVFLGLAALMPWFLPLLFGETWRDSVTIAQILCLIAGPYVILFFALPALTALGKARQALSATALQAGLNLLAVAAAAPFGPLAVAGAHVARAHVTAPYTLWLLRRHAGLCPLQLLRILAPPFCFAAVPAILASLVLF